MMYVLYVRSATVCTYVQAKRTHDYIFGELVSPHHQGNEMLVCATIFL